MYGRNMSKNIKQEHELEHDYELEHEYQQHGLQVATTV